LFSEWIGKKTIVQAEDDGKKDSRLLTDYVILVDRPQIYTATDTDHHFLMSGTFLFFG